MDVEKPRIARHKTAIRRNELSLPVKCLLRDGLLSQDASLFDFGCGHGEDVVLLRSRGFVCNGWDPEFRPTSSIWDMSSMSSRNQANETQRCGQRGICAKGFWQFRPISLVAVQSLKLALRDFGEVAIEWAWTLSNSREDVREGRINVDRLVELVVTLQRELQAADRGAGAKTGRLGNGESGGAVLGAGGRRAAAGSWEETAKTKPAVAAAEGPLQDDDFDCTRVHHVQIPPAKLVTGDPFLGLITVLQVNLGDFLNF